MSLFFESQNERQNKVRQAHPSCMRNDTNQVDTDFELNDIYLFGV